MKRNYHVKFLNKTDVALVETVADASSDYFLIEQGRPATEADALAIIQDLPPGKSKFDKFVMAILDEEDAPIGVIDVVADYPRKGEWIIGLLLLVPDARKAGMGKVLHQVIREWAIDGGADTLRIGILAENEAAVGFWEHLGYRKIDSKQQTFGEKEHQVDVYQLGIK
ncbi:GNAT family N-acetyltransferase [Listeria ilorinensis]|uniref:GNAT family N-acetyltransferase n=1 Tax=Listeria ilorinensis TaxID=2867439 RepID=UPI001EF49538|nr:GNAT family N-acetyltransferase [Listeria ilorinensis]